MLSLYGKLKENSDGALCVDDIPVLEMLAKYQDKEVSISITEMDDIEEVD